MNNNEINKNEPVQTTVPTPTIEISNNVQPAIPTNDAVQPNNNMQQKNNNILFIIFGIIIFGIIAVIVYFAFIEDNDIDDNKTDTPQTEGTNTPVNNTDLSVWNGRYVNDNVSISIYQSANDVVTIDISTSSTDGNTVSGSSISFDVDVNSETEIIYNDDFLEDGANIVIERNDNLIIVTSSSNEDDSLLNNINGSYEKEVFTEYGWSGTYKNGDVSIILSEVDEDFIVCTITKGYSVVSFFFDENTETTLDFEDTWDNDKVNITLTESGIQVTATGENPDSLLNEVNGSYTKN